MIRNTQPTITFDTRGRPDDQWNSSKQMYSDGGASNKNVLSRIAYPDLRVTPCNCDEELVITILSVSISSFSSVVYCCT